MFVANSADIGGAIYSDAYENEPSAVNCVLFGNNARVGGGIYRAGYNPRKALHLVNSILWANTDENGASEGAQIYWEDSRALTAHDCCIQGWTEFIEGVGNFGFDPRFVDADGHDHKYGTSDDDFHLRADSPCVNAGDNEASFLPALDLDGLPRIQQCRVDLGAYESTYFRDCNANRASDTCDIEAGASGDTNSDGIPDECVPIRHPVTEQVEITSLDHQPNQRFGTAVAISQDAIVIGAPRHEDDGRNTGCVYVFRREGTGWALNAVLRAADGGLGDRFGSSIALSGETLVIGAPEKYDVEFRSGSVYVFRRGPAGWIEQAKLRADDLAGGDAFGRSVAVSAKEIVVGAPGRDDQGSNSGAAYVFRFDGQEWRQVAKYLPSNGATGDQFGSAVAIDKSSILIGAPGADVHAVDSGAAYVFRDERTGPIQETRLVPPVGKRAEHFGNSLILSDDKIVVGTASGFNSIGYAAVFQKTQTGWRPTAKLQASDSRLLDGFGQTVAFVGDDILVGAPMGFGNAESSGCAYLFRSENGQWKESAKLVASDGANSHRFGVSVAATSRLILVGAEQFGMSEGAAYVFDAQSLRTCVKRPRERPIAKVWNGIHILLT